MAYFLLVICWSFKESSPSEKSTDDDDDRLSLRYRLMGATLLGELEDDLERESYLDLDLDLELEPDDDQVLLYEISTVFF